MVENVHSCAFQTFRMRQAFGGIILCPHDGERSQLVPDPLANQTSSGVVAKTRDRTSDTDIDLWNSLIEVDDEL